MLKVQAIVILFILPGDSELLTAFLLCKCGRDRTGPQLSWRHAHEVYLVSGRPPNRTHSNTYRYGAKGPAGGAGSSTPSAESDRASDDTCTVSFLQVDNFVTQIETPPLLTK